LTSQESKLTKGETETETSQNSNPLVSKNQEGF